MASYKTKLELTWIGKENRPRLEPRISSTTPIATAEGAASMAGARLAVCMGWMLPLRGGVGMTRRRAR